MASILSKLIKSLQATNFILYIISLSFSVGKIVHISLSVSPPNLLGVFSVHPDIENVILHIRFLSSPLLNDLFQAHFASCLKMRFLINMWMLIGELIQSDMCASNKKAFAMTLFLVRESSCVRIAQLFNLH